MGTDEESTQEIDIEALRGSLAEARGTRPSNAGTPVGDREAAPDTGDADGDRTMMAASPPVHERLTDRRRPPTRDSVTRLDAFLPRTSATVEPVELDAVEPIELDAVEPIELDAVALEPDSAPMLDDDSIALADLEDVEDVEDDDALDRASAPEDDPAHAADPAPSLIGTLPGHDVAQALRAMIGDAPEGADPAQAWPAQPSALDADAEMAAPGPRDEDDALPAFSLDDDSNDDPLEESQVSWPRAGWGRDLDVTKTTRPAMAATDREATALTRGAVPAPRRPGADIAETTAVFQGPVPSIARPVRHDPRTDEVAAFHCVEEQARTTDEHVGLEAAHALGAPSPLDIASPSVETEGFAAASFGGSTRAFTDGDEVAQLTARLNRADLGLNAAPAPASVDVGAPSPAAPQAADDVEEISDAEIVELVPDEIIEDDQTNASIGASVKATSAGSYRPSSDVEASAPPPLAIEELDAEERGLLDERRFGPLIAVYRQRLADTDGPNRKATLLLKIAHVYETGLGDENEAFQALVEAFEIAPDNTELVSAIDRLGKQTQRIGELADKVKRKLLPGAPDDKRVVYLGHLVYWYERVLGRGREVSSFVSEIERHDKVHPVVLKRAAQLAAMNGDTKSQREHLTRALERTTRSDEKVAIHLALASAYAGTPDALKHYEAALRIDPTSLVALQGVKRLGKEKEKYDQIQWALERQAEVAPTEAERIDALLELAELQETKFLKREAAADLLERVLVIEPSHPAALKGLERCYHALRDWPRLARILGIRAEHTFDKKTKVELFELAAEVHESKLGDPASAVEVYRNLLVVEPKHRRALGDLARLYEKLGDWANVATYKARLAELAPTKRASSQELVKLGDFLASPDRDPIAAKLQYERAVVVDPTNAAGWEALQRLAAEAGDDRRVIECLEQRNKHTEVPRQRAAILVELARAQLAQGDEVDARRSFEAAIRADASNEAAAVAMLDAYTTEERWAEAAPLCELLVNAAIRDRDGDALFIRLRLATRIAAALGDAERALTSAVAALDARPEDADAQADLIVVTSQCRETGPLMARANEYLARIAEQPDALPAAHLGRLATLLHDAGDVDGAAGLLERARHLEPEDQEITKALAEVYLAQGDFPRACKLKVDMARNATNADTRFDLFCEAGEIWARRADELEKAASVFEEARALKPHDPWLLQTLTWLYGELGEWDLLTGILQEAAQGSAPTEKVASLLAIAEVARDKLDDRLRAADLYDQVLDVDRKRLDVFEELVRTLTEEKDWERLERAYRKMIARVKDDDEPQLQFLLFHQLGLIYRDRLGDASRAYDALDAASRLRPDDAEVRKIVVELLVVTDNLDNAVARLRDEIDRDPHEAQLYAELYELFLRQHFFDKAWCAINVFSRLREPTAEQRRFHEDYAPMPLDGVPGQIVEQAWRSHVFHTDLDRSLTNIFAQLTPVVAQMRWQQLRAEHRVHRPFTPNHSRLYDLVRGTLDNAAEILAVNAPELLLGDPKGPAPFTPALAPFGSLLVCPPAVESQASSLVYLVGKRLAEQRPELAARAFFPTAPDLTSLLHSAVRVSRNEITKDAAGAALDQSLAAALAPNEAATLRSVVLQATAEGSTLDVKAWLAAADLSSMRAGLLVAGDVEPARDAILAEGHFGDRSARDRVGELYKFATSDLYSDLRGAIGVAVQG